MNVVHRTEFRVLRGVSVARVGREFPDPPWAVVSDADLDPLIGRGDTATPEVPFIYWIFDPPGSTTLREMTPAEKAAADADAANVSAAKTQRSEQLLLEMEAYLLGRYSLRDQSAFAALLPTASGLRLTELTGWYGWVESVYAAWHAATLAVAAAVDVPAVEAVTIDFATLSAADPTISLAQLMAL